MKLSDIEVGKSYTVSGYGNLSSDLINEVNKIGLIVGEVVYKNINIKNNKNVLIFDIENTTYSINKKYTDEIEVVHE